MELFKTIRSKLGKHILSWEEKKTAPRAYASVRPEDIVHAASVLYFDLNMRFIIASGIDTRNAIEILYHFADDASGAIVSLRVLLADKKNLKIASLSGLFKGAAWIEREIHELLGVDFEGNLNLNHLLLAEDWPRGNFPLRRDND